VKTHVRAALQRRLHALQGRSDVLHAHVDALRSAEDDAEIVGATPAQAN
jgi:hypothetical protein